VEATVSSPTISGSTSQDSVVSASMVTSVVNSVVVAVPPALA